VSISAGKNVTEKRVGGEVCVAPPLISVIIPAFNAANFIAETIDSVFRQTFQDFEVVVVNDGSPDTRELESALQPFFSRIVYLAQSNSGTASARNTGIRESRGELIAFLDCDDIWFPQYLESQLSAMRAGDFDMFYCDAELFGDTFSRATNFMQRAPSEGFADFSSIVSGKCNVITSGTLVSKKRVLEVGGFDETLPRIGSEDFDLWLRIAKNGAKIGYQRKILLKYRVRPNSLSGDSVERAQRTVSSLQFAKQKMNLSADEKAIVDKTLKHAEAELDLELGKAFLIQDNFAEARRKFASANLYFDKFKLKLADKILMVSPRLLAALFKKFRARELPFIPKSGS
jgi:glycosyltransferase involved in cell wall biosynthesis